MEKQKLPPQFFLRFFRWFCHPKLRDHIEGDLIETYNSQLNERGKKKADVKFIIDVLLLLRPGIIKPTEGYKNLNNYGMIKSYVKIALRTINKNKVYSIINVLGLSLGLCACITIYLITSHEFSFDTFQVDKDRIYRIVPQSDMSVPAPVPLAVRDEISGIEAVTAVHFYDPKIKIPDGHNPPKPFEAKRREVIITDPEYFKVFEYKWLAGNPNALSKPFKVVLSEQRARRYFGSLSLDEIIGKEIMYDSLIMTIAGIVQEWRGNTDFPATDFVSFSTIKNSFLQKDIQLDAWNSNSHSSQAFVKLNKGSAVDRINSQLKKLVKEHTQANTRRNTPEINENNVLKLQPFSEIHFNPNNEKSPSILPTLYTLIGLAFFILLLAVINYVNLSTAQSVRRSKEIGVRKVLGGSRRGLIFQFLTETFILAIVAVGVGMLLVNPVLSGFNSFIPQGVKFNLQNSSTAIFLIGVTLFTAFLAGFYPAKILSSCSPSVNLKGSGLQKGSEKWLLRKGLIVFQFSISLFFIIGTLVMNSQIRYIMSKDKGFTTSNIVTFRTVWGDDRGRSKILAERIRHINGIEKVAVQSMPPMGFILWFNVFTYKGNNLGEIETSIKPASSDFIPLYDIHLVAGRNIVDSDTLRELVVNRSLLTPFGLGTPENAIGQLLYFDNRPYPIVGVVEDFHERSFHDPIGPCVIGSFSFPQHSIAIKFPSAATQKGVRGEILKKVEKLFKETFPDEMFNSHFIEDEIGWMHEDEQKTATLMNASMLITVFISCMGIFGLAMFTTEMRVKEIGIRKVLGATVTQITTMLSREFMILISVAILIATPVSWYFMNRWLMEFAFRVHNTIWLYIISGIAALCIGLITISSKTIAAASANPVNSLRSE